MNMLALAFLKKYLKRELDDFAAFCVLAVGLGFLPISRAKMGKLCAAAARHVLQYGTPTETDVRQALGL